jgi:hypothetical protein
MHPKNRNALEQRVATAAEAALAAKGYASSIDVLVGIGWLDPAKLELWRRGQVDFLERVVVSNLSRISEAMKLFRSWAAKRGLSPSQTAYVTWGSRRRPLRFSRSGAPGIEALYRTHWVSRGMAERKRERRAARERPAAKVSRPPELEVVESWEWELERNWERELVSEWEPGSEWELVREWE